MSYQKEGKKVPLRGRECSSQQVPAIGKRYSTYREYAKADLSDIYGSGTLKKALHYEAKTFAHCWFENENGKFNKNHPLPVRTQFSSINDIEEIDYNGDEFIDLLVVGNLYQAEVETPRSDSGLGLVLIGSSQGFQTIPPEQSGLLLRGDIKNVSPIQLSNNRWGYLMGTNDDQLRLMELTKK